MIVWWSEGVLLHTPVRREDDKVTATATPGLTEGQVNIVNIGGEPERAPHWSNGVPRDVYMYISMFIYIVHHSISAPAF